MEKEISSGAPGSGAWQALRPDCPLWPAGLALLPQPCSGPAYLLPPPRLGQLPGVAVHQLHHLGFFLRGHEVLNQGHAREGEGPAFKVRLPSPHGPASIGIVNEPVCFLQKKGVSEPLDPWLTLHMRPEKLPHPVVHPPQQHFGGQLASTGRWDPCPAPALLTFSSVKGKRVHRTSLLSSILQVR